MKPTPGWVIISIAGWLLTFTETCAARVFVKPPFRYSYTGQDTSVVHDLDRRLRERLPQIEEILGAKLPVSVRVDLTLTRGEFIRLTQGRVPRWAGGVAYAGRGRVIVKAPNFFGEGVPLDVLTTHELVHILLYEASGGNELPRWFDEGFASLLAAESRHGSLALLARAAAANRLIGLPRIDRVLSYSAHDAELAYAEARSAAAYIISRFGWGAVKLILVKVRAGEPFDQAFWLATGVDYVNWQVEFLDYARQRYAIAVLLEIDNLIWIVIVFLGILAIIVVFVRQRIQLKKWRDEEESEDYDPFIP